MQKSTSNRPAYLRVKSTGLARLDARIVSAADVEQRLYARDVLEQANREIEQAKKEIVLEKERGYRDGFDQGRSEALMATTHVALVVSKVLERWMNESEQDLIQLVIDAFIKLIGHTPNSVIIASLVKEGLNSIGSTRGITIKVPDPMVEVARESARRFGDESESGVEFTIVGDSSLQGGDVMLQTAFGVIDLREQNLKNQLSSMLSSD